MRVALAVILATTSVPSARADDDQLPLTAVTGTLARETVTFDVRYRVEIEGPTTTMRSVELPDRASVTGATIEAGGERHVLELLPASRVAQRFATLTDAPAGRARGWGIRLHDDYDRRLGIDLAVPRPATIAIRLAITTPTCFVRDWRYVSVPETWLAAAPATARVPEALGDEIEARCGDHEGSWLRFPSRELAARPSGDRIGATASQLDLGDRHLAKLELALAGKLSDVPRDLATAIVVDASRSMSFDELEAQRELVASYLTRAGGRVQVIAFARTARPLLPGWMDAPHAAPRIARALTGLALGNGSNVDVALREAAAWLGRVKGTRRIVLVTDERLAARLEKSIATLRTLVGPGVLVNTAVVGGETLARDDEAVLAPLAKATRGITVRGGGDATMLARPIALDHVTIATPGWTELHSDRTGPFAFAEGSSSTWLGISTLPPQPITISGLLWNTPVTRVVRPDPARGLALARELAASSQLGDEGLQDRVELAALAVSSRWSLFATWGGSGGYADTTGSGYGYGLVCGCDGGGGFGQGRGVGGMVEPVEDLHPQLARAIASCRPEGEITVGLELTFAEIVDVTVAARSEPLRRCVEEAIWNTWLVIPRPAPRLSRTIRVQ